MKRFSIRDGNAEIHSAAKYAALCGGYTSFDQGCTAWGTILEYDSNFIGESAGVLRMRYRSGREQSVPLIFGHTLWFREFWQPDLEPFSSDSELKKKLSDSLFLKGALERAPLCVLNIETPGEEISWIAVENFEKKSRPLFFEVCLHDGDETFAFSPTAPANGANELENQAASANDTNAPDLPVFDPLDPFFKSHTIRSEAVSPEFHGKNSGKKSDDIAENLSAINAALLTFETDFEAPFLAKHAAELSFSGDNLAELATEVFFRNREKLMEKVDDDGFLHTSSKATHLWFYQGFGPYRQSDVYFDKLYSRDAGRAILTLVLLGETDLAERALDHLHRWLMYYPEHPERTFDGEPVRGHWSVMPNEPYIYSEFLAPVGNWPTKFTRERFGSEHKNLGNLETDGHGLMMTAAHAVWMARDRSPDWVRKNYVCLKEAADFLVWQLEREDLTFSRDGLLYGETEAAMNSCTLYANIPCMTGLNCYADMAETIGELPDAERWCLAAARIRTAVGRDLSDGNRWKEFGFFHDPVVTMTFDIAGFDFPEALPEDWLKRSENTYLPDRNDYIGDTLIGPRGLGYDHSMMTQNALLLDRTGDAERLTQNLVKLCYAPRLPDPFVVPEGATVRPAEGIYRRQGDLGNLVQQAEVLKTFSIVAGIAPSNGQTVRIEPKLPEGWKVTYREAILPGMFGNGRPSRLSGFANRSVPDFSAELSFSNLPDGADVRIKIGPFPADVRQISLTLNGSKKIQKAFLSGDAAWCEAVLIGGTEFSVRAEPCI